VACVECLRAGAQLVDPKLTHEQLVAIAGNCLDVRHRLAEVSDDLLPRHEGDDDAPHRGRRVLHLAVIGTGLVLAGAAAYGVVPGELGHHGAEIEHAPGPARTGGDHAVGGASAIDLGDARAHGR
jgi:hypothetical protein